MLSIKFVKAYMVSFCEKVVREVKSASSEVEIREIIMRSLNSYQSAHGGQYNSVLVLNLIVSMRAAYVELPESEQATAMLLTAISVLREYQK